MKRFTRMLAIAGLAFVTFSPAAHALGTPKADEFVRKASLANMFEVEAARLALTRSQNADVRAFAQKMVDQHTTANNALRAAAESAGVSASISASLDEKHQKKLNELAAEDANDFDEEYADEQGDAHKKSVRLFKKYAEKGEHAGLKAYASQTLPTLQAHRTEAKALEDKIDALD